jgi:hypothetical protein
MVEIPTAAPMHPVIATHIIMPYSIRSKCGSSSITSMKQIIKITDVITKNVTPKDLNRIDIRLRFNKLIDKLI